LNFSEAGTIRYLYGQVLKGTSLVLAIDPFNVINHSLGKLKFPFSRWTRFAEIEIMLHKKRGAQGPSQWSVAVQKCFIPDRDTDKGSATRVVAVCSSPFELECLVALLRRDLPICDVFGFAAIEDYAGEAVEGDIVVLDFAMPQAAVAATQRGIVALKGSQLPILLIALVSDASDVAAAVAAGADVLFSKRSSALLATAFVATLLSQGGEARESAGPSQLRAPESPQPEAALLVEDTSEIDGFTKRELEVIDGLVGGVSNKQIARTLSLSENTIKVYVRNVMRKLSARNRTEVAVSVYSMRLKDMARQKLGTPTEGLQPASALRN
jgi:DNA-binding NarL/FixJ family response regulator